jgi:hypothetical protein
MTYEKFISLTEQKIKPVDLSDYLLSLWHEKNDDWETAHSIIQKIPDQMASHIHAYLHRKEGDIWNAKYWYNRAEVKLKEIPLGKEWDDLVKLVINS